MEKVGGKLGPPEAMGDRICCKGKRALAEALHRKYGVETEVVMRMLGDVNRWLLTKVLPEKDA